MRILAVSPTNFPPSWYLWQTMPETFAKHGHTFTESPDEADICFFDLHNGNGQYDEDTLHIVLERGIKVVPFDQFEWTDPQKLDDPQWIFADGCRKLIRFAIKGDAWARWVFRFYTNGQIKAYFLRRMPSKWLEFPDFCRPMDLVLYDGHDFPAVSKDELASRPNDICFIGSPNPYRRAMMDGLAASGLFNIDCEFRADLPHDEWLERHRYAKTFVSGDGPGDCSDRIVQLATIAPILKYRNHHKLPCQWRHGHDCIEASDPFGNLEAGDTQMVRGFLDDPQKLHQIYLNGISHLHAHNTSDARCEYILCQLREFGVS